MTAHFSVPSDWYQTFFTAPVMRFWEAAVPQEATDSERTFILRHLRAQPPATLLDVPCGSGRHALALAQAGFAVTGIDLSQAALSRAAALAQTAALRVSFVHSDMLELNTEGPHDGLICMGNSLGYFEPALTRTLLHRFAATLRPGGRLILDTSVCAESLLPLAAERSFAFPGGTYEQQITYDTAQSVINTQAQLTIDGRTHELRYRHFVMTSGELVRSLSAAGFDIRGLYGDTEDGAFVPGSPRLLLVAERE
jgi:cyclopropane fatty-acyl-phospholipid synthase-like methyltransferase